MHFDEQREHIFDFLHSGQSVNVELGLTLLEGLEGSTDWLADLKQVQAYSCLAATTLFAEHVTLRKMNCDSMNAFWRLRLRTRSLAIAYGGSMGFPEAMGDWAHLEELHAFKTKLKCLPENIGKLNRLQRFEVVYGLLSSLPRSFAKLKSLRSLNLTGNQLTELVDLSAFQVLQTLDISQNKLQHAPPSLAKLEQLQSLKMGSNPIRKLCASYKALSNLEELILPQAKLEQWPGDLSFPKLKRLYLAHNELQLLPDSFFKHPHLEELDLDRNDLSELPDKFDQMPKLRILKVSGNTKLRVLPPSILKAKKLVRLEFHHTNMPQFPGGLEQLPSLRYLGFRGTNIAELPFGLGPFPHVYGLDFRDNRIEYFPEGFQRGKVGYLDLSNNPLSSFPSDLSPLKGLSSLSLLNTALPDSEKLRLKAALPDVKIRFDVRDASG